MNAELIIRNAIPNADESLIEHIIWGRTPYPFAEITPKILYRAARRFIRAEEHGLRLCDWCNRVSLPNDFTCQKCTDALAKARESHD